MSKQAEVNESALKHLFGRELLSRMAKAIGAVYPDFDRRRFLKTISKLEDLEMKPRVRFIRDELKDLLPEKYPEALEILLSSAHSGHLNGFDLWPYTEFIQLYGIDDPRRSLKALKVLTTKFTSEWAVRPFIKKHPQETLKFLLECASDRDTHVRRWATEGTRPRLPWGERLGEFVTDPSPAFPILERLKFDPELYVRKSVSNHLNDIAKDHPKLVVEILSRWKKEAGPENEMKIDWTIQRALRTLIKDGHPGALGLIGVSTRSKIDFNDFNLKKKTVAMGEHLEFDFEIRSTSSKSQKIVVDYVVHFMKSNRST
ncbi:MAG: DNA alkylation repair protein, partial [Bdellovibrionota bacterium]